MHSRLNVFTAFALITAFVSGVVHHAPAAAGIDGPWRTEHVLSANGRMPLAGQVDALAWLAGRWAGEGLGGTAEFSMSPPSAGTMHGTFMHAKDGTVEFYEFIVVGDFDGRTAVRLKHFNPDLTGWEERDRWMEFPLLAVDLGRAAYFDGLTYRLDEDGSLNAYVIARSPDGIEREFSFRYRPAMSRTGHDDG